MRACGDCGADVPPDARFCRSCGTELSASQYPAGWYDDPWREYQQRWWDGNAWSTHGRSTPPPTAIGAGRPAPQAQPSYPAQTQPTPQPTRQPETPWAAGWYGDPWGQAERRWWDGTSWTTNLQGPPPGQHPAPGRAPNSAAGRAPGVQQGSDGEPPAAGGTAR